ncbi:uroporphyrinogen-III C-methyltransferase [Defluviimonas sp. D31]|uniref:uroporphyrinogen-III C-methyltransferase n=1 Tax=Defluviimonas sp. D31 TaxID=3083253 RepID=UPI00296E4C23|nr:uroporphyrinogen-III C-methyltransferase [Defluviimonas sp. D31]MDW4550750.1 uroporphyrinogen-III C-methyltransferase [Defluviimonas sp. D31]
MTTEGQVHLVGAGPGDPELLTLRAHRLLTEADVIVHDRLVSPEIMALIPAATRRISVGKATSHHTMPQESINRLLVDLARQGLNVVRLKGGDPLIFGRGSEEAEALRDAGIPHDYVPGITAAQGAASTTGVPLTHRGLATGVRYVTGHRAADAALDLDWDGLARPDTTLVIYMGAATMAAIAAELIRRGRPADLPAMAVASATTPREARVVSTLSRVAEEAAGLEAPVLFIVGEVVSLHAAQPLPELLADLPMVANA